MPRLPLKISCFLLPDEPSWYFEPALDVLPDGWRSIPADRPSVEFGSSWLRAGNELGLIVPSVVLALEKNIVLNPRHPAFTEIQLIEQYDFAYDPRMV